MSDQHDKRDDYNWPRDEARHPRTKPSADKSTTLHRFYVEAVVYAPDRASAIRLVRQASIYLEAARVVTGMVDR